VANRGAEAATLHVLPHVWFRNTWWMAPAAARPALRGLPEANGVLVIEARHPDLGTRYLYAENARASLFTENETNSERLFERPNPTEFVKTESTTRSWAAGTRRSIRRRPARKRRHTTS
jgi:hypothetical protein